MFDDALFIVFLFNLWKVFSLQKDKKRTRSEFQEERRKKTGKVVAHRAENGSTTMKQSCRIS